MALTNVAFVSHLIDGLRRLGLTWPRISLVKYFSSQREVPTQLARWEMVVVGAPPSPKWVIFDCPCGRGDLVKLNLQSEHDPHWRLSVRDGHPTISPSIDYTVPPYCHYWIRDGGVRWAPDGRSGKPPRRRHRS